MMPQDASPIPTIVHVIDDDPGMRKSLRMLMESASIAAKLYETSEQFLAASPQPGPGCIVLDLRMPGMGGLELLRTLRSRGVNTPAIIISGHADVPAAVRGMKLGAVDLLQKPFEPHILLEIVRKALETSRHDYLRQAEQYGMQQRLRNLTAREHELLKMVVGGKSNKQIAAELDISIKTVANHRASLMAKTGAVNAADLARMAVNAGVEP